MRRVVVIGAGAAGTMAAIFAAGSGAETLLVERTRDGGRKILVSGGGRCNVLPARLDETRFVTDSSPNTLRKIVRGWPLAEQVAFFEREVGIALEEEVESAKLFPVSHRARDVRDGLLALARQRGARLLMDTLVTDIVPRDGGGWDVLLEGAPPIEADAVIVATGGLSVPNTGSDGAGLRILERLGHTLHPTYAALTPVTAERSPFAELAGVSLQVALTARDEGRSASASGGFLFTHRGYSGPSVLNVSHVVVRSRAEGAVPPARVTARWTEHDDDAWESLLRAQGARTVSSVVRAELPHRLAAVLLEVAGVDPARLLADLTRDERRRLVETLVRGELPWSGDEGYRKAEVTGGGVRLSEIDPRTMESRIRPGLYLCGEVLDAFGPIGGYNFLWAWATGRAAGLGAADPGAGRAAA
ncbi:MAG TPA: aminoacetone oxidase family FAD-binding enzyme [Gemmatimonadaceae bacterium]|nr:aminoacetone oxidase family FAD-binding enzyme [Gemmatimonadaceae bacterium]